MREDFEASAKDRSTKKRKYPTPISFRPRNEEERKRIVDAAHGMSVGSYIRQCISRAEGKRIRRSAIQDKEELARVLALLGQSRIANNLNQLAYEANSGSMLFDDDTRTKINEAYEHVCSMRASLIKALGLLERHPK
jgi:hypothetical protein